jgi:hypothetical protein
MLGRIALLVALFGVICSRQVAAEEHSVLTYHGDPSRSGNFVVPSLTWEKARAIHLDQTFKARVTGHLYAQPLYWRVPGTDTAMLLVATEDNIVQAFDAQSGIEMWRRRVGNPIPRSSLGCGNINPLGITGTPVIDPASGAIYFDAAIEDPTGPHHRLFGLALSDGSILEGWPVDVGDVLRTKGHDFHSRDQGQRSALTILDGTLYVAFGGHFGDCGDYRGRVVGVPLHDPDKVVSWQTRARGGGIWAPGGLSVVGRELFFATGNTLDATSWSDGEAVFRVPADLQWVNDKRNYFAPSEWKKLDQNDEDLGGTNPIPLDVPAPNGSSKALILGLGKDRNAYLLDRNDLGGVGGQLAKETVSATAIRTAPAAYPAADAVFAAFQGPGTRCPSSNRDNGLTVLKIGAGSPPALSTAWCGALRGEGSPIVTTTDGHSNPIVWIVGAEGDNRLHGFRGDTGEPIFTGQPLTGLRHFQTLIATEDRLYVGADERVYAFLF